MKRPVIVLPEAGSQIETARDWWRENRQAATELFDNELDDMILAIREMPLRFPIHYRKSGRDIRRAWLRRTRHAIYFYATDTLDRVVVVALWHSARGSAPPLP